MKMKKLIVIMICLVVLTGCGKTETEEEKKQENIIGKWITKYELSVFGEVTEEYVFKENNECVRMLNTGSDIVEECTYEITDEGIRIIWESKIDKESFSKYVEIDENTIYIAEHKYTRE